jgi:hypothetical protein
MTEADLRVLRTAMVSQRRALLDRLAPDTAGGNLIVGQVIEPGFLRLLADTHTAIAAVDAELNAEHIVVERVTP